jgi:hypothetical protein
MLNEIRREATDEALKALMRSVRAENWGEKRKKGKKWPARDSNPRPMMCMEQRLEVAPQL